MNRLIITFLCFAFFCNSLAQIKGVVVDERKKPIESVHIQIPDAGKNILSDSLGRFTLVAEINDLIEFHHISYQSLFIPYAGKGIDTVILRKKDFSLEEVNVTSFSNADHDISNINSIKRIPSFLGEPDIIKYLGTLPGVTSLGLLDAGIYVRGGNSSQNAYLVNGTPVANPQHMGGLISVYDPFILNYSKFYKSGYPSKYNGYLASYIDMKPVDYIKDDKQINISLGLLSSSLKAKLKPDKKKKTLLGISFRQSYFQLLANVYNNNKERNEHLPSYSFNDLTVSYSFPVFGNWKTSVFALVTSDKLPFNFSNGSNHAFNWGSYSGSAKFSGAVSKKINGSISLGYNSYKSNVDANSRVSLNNKNRTEQFSLNADFNSIILKGIYLNYGINTSFKQYEYSQKVEESVAYSLSNQLMDIYLESKLNITDKISFSSGLIMSSNLNNGADVFFLPRLKLNYNKYHFSAWLDYAEAMQFEERMNIFAVQSPVDVWLPVHHHLPSTSKQVSLGATININKAKVTWGAFYKRLVDIKEFETFNRENISESLGKMLSGEGNSVGTELDVQYNTNKIYARLNYTLSQVKVKFSEINNGAYFNPPYDVRNNVLFNSSLKVNTKLSFNLLWSYKSGVTATVPSGVAVAKDISTDRSEFIPVYKERYNYKMPDTHRLDINIEYLKKYENNLLKLNIGAYNLYNQQNPSFVFVEAEAKDEYFIRFKLNSNVIFPFMPYFAISYNIR